MHIYLAIYLSSYLRTYLSIYLPTYLSLSTYLSIYLSIYPSIHRSIHLHIYLPTYLCIYLSTYLSNIYLSIYLSIYPSIYLSIRFLGSASILWKQAFSVLCFVWILILTYIFRNEAFSNYFFLVGPDVPIRPQFYQSRCRFRAIRPELGLALRLVLGHRKSSFYKAQCSNPLRLPLSLSTIYIYISNCTYIYIYMHHRRTYCTTEILCNPTNPPPRSLTTLAPMPPLTAFAQRARFHADDDPWDARLGCSWDFVRLLSSWPYGA